MPIVYRGILINSANQPVTGNEIGDQLGVRPGDVQLVGGLVPPTVGGNPQGASVSPGSGCNLPAHRRPKGSPWNGTSNKKDLRVWQLDTSLLTPTELAYAADPADTSHGFLSPADAMALATFQGYVQGTANLWTLAPAPSTPCTTTVTTTEEKGVDAAERAALVDATASGGDVELLVAELKSANAAGTSRSALIAELTAGVERAADDDAAEVLLTLLDRVTGFCSPHARIDLME